MSDIRIKKMAHVLVNYSLKLNPGDLFMIDGSEEVLPLVKEVYREALLAGAHPFINFSSAEFSKIFYDNASDKQLEYINPVKLFMSENIDGVLYIKGDKNTRVLSGVSPEKIKKTSLASQSIRNNIYTRTARGETKWTLCQFPVHSAAQESGMSLEEYEDFVFSACLLDSDNPIEKWVQVSQNQNKITDWLGKKSQIRLVANYTDIQLSVNGIKWINSEGQRIFPSGEVFTSPVKESVNGKVRFSFPGIYMNREIEDISLVFKGGKVIEAKAEKGEDLLLSLLDTDEGSGYLGEFAIGTNYGIKQFTRNMLFDEKIGGTIHMALGNSFPEAGGLNKSAIHWDLLCDMRNGGEIYADDELFYKNGRFLI